VCIDCIAGNIAALEGAAICEDCPGETHSLSGAATCDLCIADYYYTFDGDKDMCGSGSSCCECPSGTACLTDGESTQEGLYISEGYWRINAKSNNVQACTWPKACIGGVNFTEGVDDVYVQYCKEGHEGPLCGVCQPLKYYFDITKAECAPCNKLNKPWVIYSRSPTLIICSFLVLVAVYLSYMSLCTIKTNAKSTKLNDKVRETRKFAKLANRVREHKTKFKVRGFYSIAFASVCAKRVAGVLALLEL